MRRLNDNEMVNFFCDLVAKPYIDLGNGEKYESYRGELFADNETNYEQMTNNLLLIYGEEERCEIYIALFEKVRDFLANVLHISGLTRLFSHHYYNIEWNMYTEARFDDSRWSFYRDHFVHQIRNAYMGYLLLWGDPEFLLIDEVMDCYKREENTRFSSYVRTCLGTREGRKTDSDKEERIVFFKTWFISALFHDIGYPLAHFQRYEKQIDTYMPYIRCFNSHKRADFLEIKALLADSYLFQAVSYQELEKRYESDDHGMLSALCLLLNYYHTGTIHDLSPVDRCSIELAAYSIYAHTDRYGIQGKKNYSSYRPIFSENPLAFLLRLCDDLQEWERMYFLIGRNSNLLVCKKCFSAVLPDANKQNYRCSCGQAMEKITQFAYRKINLVSVCTDMTMELGDRKQFLMRLNYDKFRLIEAFLIDREYAIRRYEELESLKKILVCQSYLPEISIDYFLSNNIALLKYEILREFLRKQNPLFEVILPCPEQKQQLMQESDYLEREEERIVFQMKKALEKHGFEQKLLDAEDLTKQMKEILDESKDFLYKLNNNAEEFSFFVKGNQEQQLNHIYLYYLLNSINTKVQ